MFIKGCSVQVADIIEQAETLSGQEIVVEGFIIVIERAKRKIAFVSTRHDINHADQKQIFIDHDLAELKTIIRPLPTMELMFRGVLTNPPYFYRFYAEFHATLMTDEDNVPTLQNITQISIKVPYVGKTSELTIHDAYAYSAQVKYTQMVIEESNRSAQAIVTSQKKLQLQDYESEIETISPDENRYARSIAKQTVRVSGWLENLPSVNDIMNHMVLRTSAVRASMVAVGPLREMALVWLRPSPTYTILKRHIPHTTEQPLHQHVEVIGEIDYIHEDNAPHLEIPLKLFFSKIYRVIIHEENYLW